MFVANIGYFCAHHEDWRELLTREPYCLKIKEDGPYTIFNYDQIRSDFNIKLVREARGIIFRTGEWEQPVCWAFNKFGNWGESYAPSINWDTAFVTEKIDGSLIKVWWDNGSWHVSTNGVIDAYKAEIGDARMSNFGEYFEHALQRLYQPLVYRKAFDDFTIDLDENLTYMFELVGPYNRVVIPYEEPDLYFLGARAKTTGEEFYCSELVAGALGMGRFKRPAHYSLSSLDACIKAAELKSWDEEGFVVADAYGNRVKVKSPAYVLAHYTRNNNVINKKHLIKVILSNEIEEFLCYAADYKEALEDVQKQMTAFSNIGNQLAAACRAISDKLEKRDYARLVKALPKIYQGLLYSNYDKDVTVEEFTSSWNENRWAEYLEAFEELEQEVTRIE